MATENEIEQALAAVTATFNDHELDAFDSGRVQEILDDAAGGGQQLSVDGGGGVHDESGVRVGAIRRIDSGEWIAEHQNEDAARSDTAVPSPPPQGMLRQLLRNLGV